MVNAFCGYVFNVEDFSRDGSRIDCSNDVLQLNICSVQCYIYATLPVLI